MCHSLHGQWLSIKPNVIWYFCFLLSFFTGNKWYKSQLFSYDQRLLGFPIINEHYHFMVKVEQSNCGKVSMLSFACLSSWFLFGLVHLLKEFVEKIWRRQKNNFFVVESRVLKDTLKAFNDLKNKHKSVPMFFDMKKYIYSENLLNTLYSEIKHKC